MEFIREKMKAVQPGKKEERNSYRTGKVWLKGSTWEKGWGAPVSHAQQSAHFSGREPTVHSSGSTVPTNLGTVVPAKMTQLSFKSPT